MTIMMVGSVGGGKTTLRQRLQERDLVYEKTQTTYREGDVLDTPGEYVEHGRFNHALLVSSFDADVVVFVESATAPDAKLPPAFASYFNRPVLGVVSKADAADAGGVAAAMARLDLAGASDRCVVSAFTGEGMDELGERLAQLLGRDDKGDGRGGA